MLSNRYGSPIKLTISSKIVWTIGAIFMLLCSLGCVFNSNWVVKPYWSFEERRVLLENFFLDDRILSMLDRDVNSEKLLFVEKLGSPIMIVPKGGMYKQTDSFFSSITSFDAELRGSKPGKIITSVSIHGSESGVTIAYENTSFFD